MHESFESFLLGEKFAKRNEGGEKKVDDTGINTRRLSMIS